MRLFQCKPHMKFERVPIIALVLATSAASALQIGWMVGAYNNLLVIDGVVTTQESFSPVYEMHLVHVGQDGDCSPTLGFRVFCPLGDGSHYAPPDDGKVGAITTLPGGEAFSFNQFIVALYEKATGKYFFISETPGGPGIEPFTLPEVIDDPFFPADYTYYPTAGNPEHRFYKGAEIPPFCTWLAEHGLVQADLDGFDAALVNQAFAVGANPADFSGLALSIDGVAFGQDTIDGMFSLVARDGAQRSAAVTNLNAAAALSLLSSATLGGGETVVPATFNLICGTFSAPVGATNATQFLRIRLDVSDVW